MKRYILPGDLYLAIQHANYSIKGTLINGKWKVTITMYDTYNFDSLRNPFKSVGNAANDFGLYIQGTGLLDAYKWSVTYTKTY